jgi:acyl-ACP thioesterase
MQDIHEELFKVRTWDVDKSDRLSMAAVYNYCQEVAGSHATELGVGTAYMQANGIVWILARMSAMLDTRPASGTDFVVRTWPRGTDRLFAIRDYEFADKAGAVLGRGRSAWMVVDAASFRPRRPEAVAHGLPTNEGRDSLADGALAIKAAEGLAVAARRSVAYSDIDYNNHMNNARYAQWIQDAVDPEVLARASRMRLDINYLAEMKPGSAADLSVGGPASLGGWLYIYAVEGRAVPDGQATFRARLSVGSESESIHHP